MECRYCQATNADDDHRCRRCGRRLRRSPLYTGASAAAPVLHDEASRVLDRELSPASGLGTNAVLHYDSAPVLPPPAIEIGAIRGPMNRIEPSRIEPHRSPEPSAPRRPITYQPSLFTSRELPHVAPFETIAPGSVQPSPRKPQPSAPRQRRRRVMPGQQSLEFTNSFASAGRSSQPVDGVIYCEAPVAIPVHRAMAAALDASIIVIALAVFGAVFGIMLHLTGRTFVVAAKTLPLFLGLAAAVVIFYKLLWCLANSDTIGQKWTRQRLVNFDGQTPSRAQRFYRTASGFLSLMAGGIGLLWGLVDEETLTWHDHISRTFPTPVSYRQ